MARPCAAAVAVLLGSVGAGAAPAPAPVPLAIPGTIVGYVGALQGLSSSTCPSTYPAKPSTPCSLKSFQAYDPPMQSPIVYGDRIIFQTAQDYSSKSTFISVSRTLQNTSTRSVDFIADCNMSLAPQTQWYNYGPVVLPPVPHATPHGGGELRPTTRDQQMQVIGYAKTDHQNSSVLVYDLDLSDSQTCSATPAAQAHLALGTDNASYLTCATRADAVEDNATGVVRSTHHALVQHDWSMGDCKGVDSRGTSTCLQLVTLTSFSNGSALDPVVTDVYGWPDGLEFSPMAPYSAGSVGCYHDDASGALMIMGVYRTNNPALVRIDGLRNNNPSVVIVRTLDYPEVHPMPGSLVNVDGNVGFMSLNNFLVYSTHGDFLRNKTLAVLPPVTGSNSPTPMRMVTYIPA